VTASFCAHCGATIPAGATFCPSCGAAATSAGAFTPPPPYGGGPAAPPGSPGPLPGRARVGGPHPGGVYPGGPWGASPESLATTRERNVRALRDVQWAAVIGLVGAVLGYVLETFENFARFLTVSSTNNGPILSLPNEAALGAYVASALVLALVGFLLYTRAFRTWRGVAEGFSTPATLGLLAVIGLVLVGAGLGLFLLAIAQAIACVGAGNPLTSGCLLTGAFWGGVALLLIGAIVLLVGYIGILIGIWRVGSHFNNSLFKIGAVLLIIPYLSVVGEILILIGARQELGRR
jgi:hypothetical protein